MMGQEENQENESFLKWIKSPTFQLSSHEQRTNDLELYMIAKNREIYDLKAALANKQEHIESNQEIYDTELGDVLFALENAVEVLSKFQHIDTVEPYIKAKEKLARFIIHQPKAIEPVNEDELSELTDKNIKYILDRTFTEQAQDHIGDTNEMAQDNEQ